MADPMLLDSDNENENSGSIAGSNTCVLPHKPVSTSESGEGLPYAPVDFPMPGDVWIWKVGRRINQHGFMQDRFLYPPKRLNRTFKGKPYLASKKAVENFVMSETPTINLNDFWSSFHWKVPAKGYNYFEKDENHGTTPSRKHRKEEMPEHSGYEGNCKARNKRCHELQPKISTLPAIDCDLCCSEIGFCRDCCCILCCRTIKLSYEGYNFIRCEASVKKNYICGHVAHLDCALRAYMAGTVGGTIGLDVEYYCRRCDNRTDLIPHINLLLKTCQSIGSEKDIKKILNMGSRILHGSKQDEAKTLQDHIDLALGKLQNGNCIHEIRDLEEDDFSTYSTGEISRFGNNGTTGNLDFANIEDPIDLSTHHGLENVHPISQERVCTTDSQIESLKLKDEIDKVLRDLKNSQEDEYRIAEKKLCAQKDFIVGLHQLLETERSELARRTSSTMDYNCDVLLTDISNRVNQIKKEVLKLQDMKEIAKGFSRVPKRIIEEHFDVQIEDVRERREKITPMKRKKEELEIKRLEKERRKREELDIKRVEKDIQKIIKRFPDDVLVAADDDDSSLFLDFETTPLNRRIIKTRDLVSVAITFEIVKKEKQKNKEWFTVEECGNRTWISYAEVDGLIPRKWVTGITIDWYGIKLRELMKRKTAGGHHPQFIICNNFFYTILATDYKKHIDKLEDEEEYRDMDFLHRTAVFAPKLNSNWTNQIPGTDVQSSILIPINYRNNHWALFVVHPNKRTIDLYDPLYKDHEVLKNYDEEMNALITMLSMYYVHKVPATANMEWVKKVCFDIPKQPNHYDCGVLVIAYMDCICREIEIEFDEQKTSEYFRYILARDLLQDGRKLSLRN